MFSLQVELKLELMHPLGFQRRGVDLITGQGSKISHALQLKSQNAKQKQYCNKFSKECKNQFSLVQFCPSTQGFPVHHHLLELAQSHVHWFSDAIGPSHPLSSPSPPTLNLSQHQGLFKWVGSSHEVAKVLELQLQHQSFQWIFQTDFL